MSADEHVVVGADSAARSDLRLAGPAGAAWLTSAVVLGTTPRAALTIAGTLGAAGAGALAIRRSSAAAVAGVLLCASAGGAVAGIRLAALGAGPVPRLAAAGASASVELVVTGDPELHAARVRGSALGHDLVVMRARAERVVARGAGVRVRVPVVVLATGRGWTALLPTSRVAATGRLAPPRRGDLVAAVLLARGPPRILRGPSPSQRVAGRIRGGLRSASAVLPADVRGLLPGLVIGDTSRLDPALRQDFRTTGMTHLVAVSGANVAIILGAALVISRWLRLGPRTGPALAALALAGFVVLARPSPSVLRAAGMGLVVVLALASGRGRAALPALCAAVLGLLLLEPALSRSVGFALSVAATAGLLLLAPPWRERLARRLPGWLADAIAVPLAAQCACAPLIAAVSAQVSLVAVPANLLAAPAVVPATLFGVLTALVAPWCMPLGRILARLAGLPTAVIVAVAHTGARLPGAAVSWPGGVTGAALLAVASVTIGVLLAFGSGRRVLATVAVSAMLAVAGVRAVTPGWPPPGWQLVACDVGQGDALVLSAGRGTALVVDAGPDPTLVDHCLRMLRVRSVPLVVLTHLHADHVEGLPAVLRGHGVREVEIGPLDEPAGERDRVVSWVRRSGARLTRAADGEQRALGLLHWQVLAPARPFVGTNSDPNNSSIVLRVELTGFTALLTGDVEPPAQQALLQSGVDRRADVLKVPHHGSDHQEPTFLDAVDASLAITSVGAGNTYGHPSARTLQRLATDGARSYRTDRDGAVALLRRDGAVVATARRGSGTPPAGFRGGRSSSASANFRAPAFASSRAGLQSSACDRLGSPVGDSPPGHASGPALVVLSMTQKPLPSAFERPLNRPGLADGHHTHRRAVPVPDARAPPPVPNCISCHILTRP